MTFAATLIRDVRSVPRYAVDIDGTLRDADWCPFDVTVENLSAEGFRIPSSIDLPIGCAVSLGLPGIGPRGATVMRATGLDYGCRFDLPLTANELATTIAAIPLQPVPLPIGTPSQPAADAPVSWPSDAYCEGDADSRYSRLVRVAVLAVTSVLSWAAIIGVRLLIG